MAKTRSMTRNKNYNASSKKRIKNSEDVGGVPWADLNCDVLYIVMVRLGVFDYPAFSRVCKSWRSVALSNRNMFISSRPPMSISFSTDVNEKECCLEDFDGRKFKIILPHSSGRTCRLTCGYLVLFREETHDFWLVNPITMHQLHFPEVPFNVRTSVYVGVTTIVVFSPSISGWVLVVAFRDECKIWSSIAGEGTWNHVSSSFDIYNFYSFKGKIYTLNYSKKTRDNFQLCQMSLTPHPKFTLLETKNFSKSHYHVGFKSLGGNLYVVQFNPVDWSCVSELDFGEMKWVFRGETREEYAFFASWKHILQTCVLKREPWIDPRLKYRRDSGTKKRVYFANMWYFPHDCLNVNFIHE